MGYSQNITTAPEYDKAIEKLNYLLSINSTLSIEELKINPFWDPIRDMKAFKDLLENPDYQIKLTKPDT